MITASGRAKVLRPVRWTVKVSDKVEAQCCDPDKGRGWQVHALHERMSPQLVARTSDITVTITVPEGTERADEKMVMPGDNGA